MQRKPCNVILDLDSTIISSIASDEEKKSDRRKFKHYVWEDMDGDFKVFERPGLQKFLDWLFKNFNVSIWTAASKEYGLFIIKNFIMIDPSRRLEHYLFSHHCKESIKRKNAQKDLRMLWTHFNLPGYTKDNTWIIDDLGEVYDTQVDNCIQIYPFEFREKDSHLDTVLEDKVKPQLQKILSLKC